MCKYRFGDIIYNFGKSHFQRFPDLVRTTEIFLLCSWCCYHNIQPIHFFNLCQVYNPQEKRIKHLTKDEELNNWNIVTAILRTERRNSFGQTRFQSSCYIKQGIKIYEVSAMRWKLWYTSIFKARSWCNIVWGIA